MPDFRHRSTEDEMMDDFSLGHDIIDPIMDELEVVNKLLGGYMETRSIDVSVVRIRRKIEEDQRYPIYLQTVRGVGWMLQTHEDKGS